MLVPASPRLLLVFPLMLSLHLVHEIKICLIEMMHPYISILATTRISTPLRIRGDRIERTKMAFHAPNFIFKDLVVKTRLKFTLARGGCRHVGGGLTPSEDHEIFFRRDGRGIQRGIGRVSFENFEIAGGDELEAGQHIRSAAMGRLGYLGGLVFGCGEEVGAIRGPLQVSDLHTILVDGLVKE
jgi:hypothetical protein